MHALGLKMVNETRDSVHTKKIIEQAQRGVHDVATLTALTLEEFQQSKSKEGRAPSPEMSLLSGDPPLGFLEKPRFQNRQSDAVAERFELVFNLKTA